MGHHYSDFAKTPYDTIMVSGGFDPIHVGHVRMIREAARYGDVIVVLNSDEWLMRKKGYIFMPFEERKEIVESIAGVLHAAAVDDIDSTVCEAIKRIKPHYFANGGDRTDENTPEKQICEKLGIKMLWNVGGGKIQSSSTLVNEAEQNKPKPERKRPVC